MHGPDEGVQPSRGERGKFQDMLARVGAETGLPVANRVRLEELINAYESNGVLPEDLKVRRNVLAAVVIKEMWKDNAKWVEALAGDYSKLTTREANEVRRFTASLKSVGRDEYPVPRFPRELAVLIAQEISDFIEPKIERWFSAIEHAEQQGSTALLPAALRQHAYAFELQEAQSDGLDITLDPQSVNLENSGMLIFSGFMTGVATSLSLYAAFAEQRQMAEPGALVTTDILHEQRTHLFAMLSALASSPLAVLDAISTDESAGIDREVLMGSANRTFTWDMGEIQQRILETFSVEEADSPLFQTRTGCPAFAVTAPNGRRIVQDQFRLMSDFAELHFFPRITEWSREEVASLSAGRKGAADINFGTPPGLA